MNRLVHIYVQIDGRMNIQTIYRQIDRQMTIHMLTNEQTCAYLCTNRRKNEYTDNIQTNTDR